jgi:hypothetical protein
MGSSSVGDHPGEVRAIDSTYTAQLEFQPATPNEEAGMTLVNNGAQFDSQSVGYPVRK